MSNILFIVGLPGSGKTELSKKINSQNNNRYKIIDDPKSFDQILPFLDQDLIISDPAFCLEKNRELAIRKITEENPNVKIDWIFFENDPDQCLINAERRENKKVDSYIKNSTKTYTIPKGSNIIKVWR